MAGQILDQEQFEQFVVRLIVRAMPEEQARFEAEGREYIASLYRRHAQGQSVPQHPQEDEPALQMGDLGAWLRLAAALLGTFNASVGLFMTLRPKPPGPAPVTESDDDVHEVVLTWRRDLIAAGLAPDVVDRVADDFSRDLARMITEQMNSKPD